MRLQITSLSPWARVIVDSNDETKQAVASLLNTIKLALMIMGSGYLLSKVIMSTDVCYHVVVLENWSECVKRNS